MEMIVMEQPLALLPPSAAYWLIQHGQCRHARRAAAASARLNLF
jgi:hypothetical protein